MSSHAHNARAPVVGGLLAGGASRRMGEHKAGAAWLDDQRLADGALAALEAVCEQVVVLGHGTGLDHRRELTRLADLRHDAGPLAGLEALLCSGRGERYVICPCDMPFVNADLLAALLAEPAEAVVAARSDGRRATMPLALHSAVLPRLQAFLDDRRPPVHPGGHDDHLLNVNTPADLQRARAAVAGHPDGTSRPDKETRS